MLLQGGRDMKLLVGIKLTDASNAAVMVFAKLNSQLDDDPDGNGDQADSSNIRHHL